MTDEFQIKLLKFADSELTPEEESCVLLDCEQSPQHWKDLALALISERRLADALAGFDDLESEGPVPQAKTSGGSGALFLKAGQLFAVSLAMLLAFVAGRYQFQTPTDQGEIAEAKASEDLIDDDTGTLLQPSLPETDFGSNGAKMMLAESDSGNEESESSYQVVNPWTVVSKPVITDEDRGAFSDAGLDVEEQNTVYIVSDSEGGRWAIPWKAVNVRYSAN